MEPLAGIEPVFPDGESSVLLPLDDSGIVWRQRGRIELPHTRLTGDNHVLAVPYGTKGAHDI
jgi:hypothetical protein